MKVYKGYYDSLKTLIGDYVLESKSNKRYQVVGIERTDSEQCLIVIRIHGRFVIKREPADVIMDDKLVENLEPIAVRAITFMAVQEQFSPDYQINSLKIGHEVEEYLVTLKKHSSSEIKTVLASELNLDKEVINKLSPADANRIGYLAGIADTVRDFKVNE